MQANTVPLLRLRPPPSNPSRRRLQLRRSLFPKSFSLPPSMTGSDGIGSEGVREVTKLRRDLVRDWVSANDGVVRGLPIYAGGISLLAVLLNRAFSGIAPVADASSSQSRADILTLVLAVTNLLTGLVWLSIRPKNISPVVPVGVECKRIDPLIPERAVLELLWAWESLLDATCCRSLVIVYGDSCALQIGIAAESSIKDGTAVDVDAQKLIQGSLYGRIMESQKQSYLANLSLYPGRTELPFLPTNTQSVILQPLGNKGIAIIGGDTIRGFTNADQAWISLIAEKLDATLSRSGDGR